jgi:hypothetical protein
MPVFSSTFRDECRFDRSYSSPCVVWTILYISQSLMVLSSRQMKFVITQCIDCFVLPNLIHSTLLLDLEKPLTSEVTWHMDTAEFLLYT